MHGKGRFTGNTCLTNGSTIMILDDDSSKFSGEGGIDTRYLCRAAKLLCILWRGYGYAIGCYIRHFPDAAVRVKFQAAQRKLDGCAACRWIFDEHNSFSIVRTAPAQYGRGSVGIPLENELGKVLSGGRCAEPPLLIPLPIIHLILLKFSLEARDIREQARKGDRYERPGAI